MYPPENSCFLLYDSKHVSTFLIFAEKIFAPFQRLHGRSEYKGTGIGLAVCRRIVERHNGHITAKSTPGEGATFLMIMPKDSDPFSNNNNGDTHNDA